MNQLWKRGMVATGLCMAAMTGGVSAQQAAPEAAPGAAPRTHHEGRDLPGPIDNVQDLQDTGKMLFKLADTNNDGQISQKEAIDAGNLLVGGFFFRADTNGDGTISQEEARQARESLFQQMPLLRMVLDRAKSAKEGEGAVGAGTNPAQGVAALLDTNGDKKLEASEVRQAVQTSVQGLFATADTNRDGELSPREINAAIIGAANAAAQAAFQAADADRDGSLSREEFDKAAIGPINTIFGVMDANGDGKISPQEAQNARRVLGSQIRSLRIPEPANSPRNVIESGQPAGGATPVPVPTLRRPAVRTAPAVPAPAPAPEP